jgi:hypothetical protein
MGVPLFADAIKYLAKESGKSIYLLRKDGVDTAERRFDMRWRCHKPEQCIASILESNGLQYREGNNNLLVVGDDHVLSFATVVVFAYSYNDRETIGAVQNDREFEAALYSELPLEHWLVSYPIQWLGLGYYWIPEEDDTLIVVASFGYSTQDQTMGKLSGRVFKVRANRVNNIWDIDCIWSGGWEIGMLAVDIKEDFDGDGVLDYVFTKPGADYPDFILAGDNGRVLAKFTTEVIAVEKNKRRIERFAVKHGWRSEASFDSRIFQYSENERKYVLDEPVFGVGYTKNQPDENGIVHGRDTAVVFASKIRADGSNIRVYVLPELREGRTPERAEIVHIESPELWHNWIVTNDPMTAFREKLNQDEVSVLFTYFPDGFDENDPYYWHLRK